MKRRMIVGVFLGVLAALAVGAWSQALPENHKITRSGRYTKTTKETWAVVADLEHAMGWRTDLASMERLADVNGKAVWRETHEDGETVTLQTVETIEGRRLIRCIIDQDLAFGGCWTIEVSPRDKVNSVVTVTESLRIRGLAWRLTHPRLSRRSRIDAFLLAIGAQFGEVPKIADIARELNTPREKKKKKEE